MASYFDYQYPGLFYGMPEQDRNLALMAIGTGLLGGQGRNRQEALASGLQGGLQNFMGISALSGRQGALAEESMGRRQDRALNEQRFGLERQAFMEQARQRAVQQMMAERQAAAQAEIEQQYPQYAPFFRAGMGEKVLPQIFPKPAEQSSLAKLLEEQRALPADAPAEVKRAYADAIQKMSTHPPPVSVQNFPSPVVAVGPDGRPQLVQFGSKGEARPTGFAPPPDTKPEKDPTEFQAKAGLYFQSMSKATETLSDLEKNKPEAVKPGIHESMVPANKLGAFVSGDRQRYMQAARQWIDSINRVRSGAQLPEYEYERALLTFFPAFGEGPATIQQKAAARKQEEEAMRSAAGRALPSQQQPNKQPNVIRYDSQGNRLP